MQSPVEESEFVERVPYGHEHALAEPEDDVLGHGPEAAEPPPEPRWKASSPQLEGNPFGI